MSGGMEKKTMRQQSDARNITMMMDLYELTMANGYFLQENAKTRVSFDVFYRKNPDGGGFAIFAGLEQVVEYITNMHFEEEDITYDEVSAALMIGQIRKNRTELLDCLSAYYRILILKEDAASVLDDLSINTGFEL